ncbi:queuosine precursor transporter [Candidatus Woesearchaeota archaeon]|nr:queuosine precursor transporter [Candidatus Woesearchaeota archaeon]
MENIYLWLIFILIDLSIVLLAFKLFGKAGLYVTIVMSIILANIQVIKLVDLVGITVTLGNILYGSIFFATDLLNEFHGKKEAQKAVWMGFFIMIVSAIYMQLSLMFKPAADDFIQPHLAAIFSFYPRVVFASLVAYIISQLHDVWSYNFWKKKTKGKHLWIRNNASTWVSQLIDTTIFCSIAFIGVFSMEIFWSIFITTYVMKIIVAAIDTPFIYLAKKYIKNV